MLYELIFVVTLRELQEVAEAADINNLAFVATVLDVEIPLELEPVVVLKPTEDVPVLVAVLGDPLHRDRLHLDVGLPRVESVHLCGHELLVANRHLHPANVIDERYARLRGASEAVNHMCLPHREVSDRAGRLVEVVSVFPIDGECDLLLDRSADAVLGEGRRLRVRGDSLA